MHVFSVVSALIVSCFVLGCHIGRPPTASLEHRIELDASSVPELTSVYSLCLQQFSARYPVRANQLRRLVLLSYSEKSQALDGRYLLEQQIQFRAIVNERELVTTEQAFCSASHTGQRFQHERRRCHQQLCGQALARLPLNKER